MSYYSEIYKQRLGRNGNTTQERLEYGRRKNFERFLHQSPHYTTFDYNGKKIECVFEPSRQDQTRTLMHLLCRVDEAFNVGDIVTIAGYRFMFYYWEQRQDSGYNRWTVVKISQPIDWLNEDGTTHTSEAYIWDQQSNMLKNELKSRSRSAALYLENLKLAFMLMPATKDMIIGSYLTIKVGEVKRSFCVTGIDFLSTPGILYVSMDPTMERDLTPAPEQQPGDDPDDYFWLGDWGDKK